ncbi:TcfC E-set like domain-containing protein [Aliivibrio fischeri]|uniref:Pilus assembly protein E-set like domain-containing protein n=1 Tax=Aliivibrio fischeri TaxID=668 RepID=A0A510UMW5_ALIFS|nr:TcfC E-set like domain-containing protein [Aliivibrio fischeri]MUK51221.1 hypothetical protein [Aliivibrio fischeri]GEK15919.1 hypothetical protein AFI02nite_39550 [Aliivibrio fischeri]
MKCRTLVLIVVSLYYSTIGWSANYPLEFADFFEERLEIIEIIIAGETRNQFVNGFVNYETFRLTNTADNIEVLTGYLESQQLTDSAITKIIAQLIMGVRANPGCEGRLFMCIPKDVPEEAEFVFDFDAQQLKIFVGSYMLSRNSEDAEYYSSVRLSNALVNWSDLYFYVDGDGIYNLNWSNNPTLGLPLGFFSLETQYQHRERELELYQALYDVEVDEYRAIIGYQGLQAITFNTTDFLNYGANYAGVGLSLGSSQNLLKGQKLAQKRIYFFAPQSAQLEVYQGDRLLLNKVVSSGQQSIGYDELPSGVYSITIVLKQGDQDILREQRQIVNTTQFSLPVGYWDYRVDAGVLDDLVMPESFVNKIPSGERNYGRAAFAYRPSETWLLAMGVTSNIDDSLLQTGGYWVYGDSLSIQYNLGVFVSGSRIHYGQVSVGSLSSSYRYVESDENASALTHLLYGDIASTDWNVSLSGDAFGGTGYLNYFNYQTVHSKSDNISLSWSREAFGGRFNINTTYSMFGEQEDNWNTTLTWTISLDNNLSARTGFYVDQEGLAYNRNSVTYQHSGDYGYTSSTVSIKRGRESDAEWSANVSGHRDAVGYSAYTYLNSDEQRSLSGNLSGSQIISSQIGTMTYKKGRAFVEIKPELVESETAPIDITYNILKNGEYWYRDKVYFDRTTLIKLTPYTDMAFELDADMDNVDIKEGTYHQFVMPGYYYQLNSKIVPLMSQVFLVNDMFGSPVSSVRCLGDGCKSVETLSDDGVVRVNYRKGISFKLISAERQCVYNPELMGEPHIQAYCLPGLYDENNNIIWDDKIDLISPLDAERALLYIGKYESMIEAEHILLKLQEVGLASKSIDVGNNVYIYARYLKQYSMAQRDVLESIDAYVVLDSININQLFSMR